MSLFTKNKFGNDFVKNQQKILVIIQHFKTLFNITSYELDN